MRRFPGGTALARMGRGERRGGGLIKTVIFAIFLFPLMHSTRHTGLLLKMLTWPKQRRNQVRLNLHHNSLPWASKRAEAFEEECPLTERAVFVSIDYG
jgi:hypothetical protein